MMTNIRRKMTEKGWSRKKFWNGGNIPNLVSGSGGKHLKI
jgi:hypothetical protein